MKNEITFDIHDTPSKGRHVIASKSLEAGKVVCRSAALAAVVETELIANRCSCCFAEEPNSNSMLRCSKCRFVRYCSSACQRKDWAIHRSECSRLVSIHPQIPTTTMRLLARVVDKLEEMGDSSEAAYSLVSHRSSLSEADTEGFVAVAMLTFKYMNRTKEESTPTIAEENMDDKRLNSCVRWNVDSLIDILCRIRWNSFTVTDSSLRSVGKALHLGDASLFNHSCSPNAIAMHEGASLVIRSVVPIAPGEEITIGYCELAAPREERQTSLLRNYNFACNCSRCDLSVSVMEDAVMGSVQCPVVSCCGMVLRRVLGVVEEWSCDTCKVVLDASVKEALFAGCTSAKASHKECDDNIIATKLHEFYKEHMHVNNLDRAKSANALMNLCIAKGDWETAFTSAMDSIPAYDIHYPRGSPLPPLQRALAAKLALQIGKLKLARHLAGLAIPTLEVTHGRSHAIVRELGDIIHEASMSQSEKRGRFDGASKSLSLR